MEPNKLKYSNKNKIEEIWGPLKGALLHLYSEGADHCLVIIRGVMELGLQFRLGWECDVMIMKHIEHKQMN
jgi:hypothetical protein